MMLIYRIGIYLLFGMIVLVSCSRTVTFEETRHLKEPTQKIKAKLDDKLKTLQETSDLWGMESGTYNVGKALLYVITHDPSSKISIGYVSSDLQPVASDFLFLGTVIQVDYRLLVKVDIADRTEILEATGKGKSYANSYNAAQEAIEKTIVNFHQKLLIITGKP